MSESEAEDGAGDEEVTLPQDLPGAGNIKQQQSAIKLTEVFIVSFVCIVKNMNACKANDIVDNSFAFYFAYCGCRPYKRHQIPNRFLNDRGST